MLRVTIVSVAIVFSMPSACAVLNFHLWHARVYFSILAYKWHDFREKAIQRKMCFDILYELFLKYFSLKEEFGEIL
jgi:hypothetical protein